MLVCILLLEKLPQKEPFIEKRGEADESWPFNGATGLFFSEQNPDSLADVIIRFEVMEEKFSPEKIRALAMRFDKQVFLKEFKEFMAECLAKGKTR